MAAKADTGDATTAGVTAAALTPTATVPVAISFIVAVSFIVAATAGCGRPGGPTTAADPPDLVPKGTTAMEIHLASEAFAAGGAIPKKHTGDGQDVSLPLTWNNVPEAAEEIAVICDDPDAPSREPWVHWVLYKIPPHVRSLPAGMPQQARPPQPRGALHGRNSWRSDNIGYRGPAPPVGHGVHHYHFKIYALDAALEIPAGATKSELIEAMRNHVIGRGELVGTYER